MGGNDMAGCNIGCQSAQVNTRVLTPSLSSVFFLPPSVPLPASLAKQPEALQRTTLLTGREIRSELAS